MSFENYARHIAEKHRLAIALAVLKDKPISISIENYIKDLQNKIIDGNADDEITVCSDDFNLDDDNFNDNNDVSSRDNESKTHSININNIVVHDNDKTFINDNTIISQESVSILKSFPSNNISNNDQQINIANGKDNPTLRINVMKNVDSTVVCNNDKLFINDTTTNSQESICILKNFASNDLGKNETHNINVTKNTDRKDIHNNDKTIINVTTINNQESVSILNNLENYNDDMLQCNDASLNRNSVMHKNVVINDARIVNDNNLNTQGVSILKDVVIDNRMDLETSRIGNNNARSIDDKNQTKIQPQIIEDVETYDLNSTYCDTQMYENAQNDYSNLSEILHRDHIDLTVNNNIHSQQIDFDMNVETQNYTHVSQSQNFNIEINENLFKKAKSTNTNDINTRNEHYASYKTTTNKDIKDNLNKYTQMEVDTQETYVNTQSIEQSLEIQQISLINEDNDRMNEHEDEINEHNDDAINESNGDSQAELIPFKVIEELNKVKSYLNKVVDRRMSVDASLDSGYKSDSQSRSSFRNSSQSSVSFLNQSGHCLFNFISTAPVSINAQEIVNEIAQVLAQLIDRLHEEEKYLVFLDELLEKIDGLIQDILTGSCDENMLLRKDEDTQRLLLLNISSNIQKYTITKIITILEKIQIKLSSTEDLYEISDTEESENICYIFHILEVLLKRYMKKKDNNILTPKSSQTDLKKSSITDIWKKKWNPNFKTQDLQDFSPKSCILTKCSEVLNKLVVLCMDGYSLISYSALQCFNVLQL